MHGVRRILEIPELIGLICGHLDLPNRARLARSCRAAFNTTLPLVWTHVDGAHNLLKLLPNLVEMDGETPTKLRSIVSRFTQSCIA
jgi:hypothetical protein